MAAEATLYYKANAVSRWSSLQEVVERKAKEEEKTSSSKMDTVAVIPGIPGMDGDLDTRADAKVKTVSLSTL